MIVYPYMVRDDAPRWLKQHMRVACTGGGVAVSAEVGTQGIVDLLDQGRWSPSPPTCRVVRRCASSVATCSARSAPRGSPPDAGSPVVVMTSEVDEQGPFVRLHEPLDAEGLRRRPQALLEEMLARHEQVDRAVARGAPTSRSRGGARLRPARRAHA